MKKLIFALMFLASPAMAQDYAAPWTKALKSEARLVSAGEARAGVLLAGMEIHLAPNTLTYWRNPGEAGVPPQFHFDGSDNLKSAKVLYPAPSLLFEGGIMAFGYESRVIFPIEVTPLDAAKPVTLKYMLDYAACEKICIPGTAEGTLMLQNAATPATPDVLASLARVPVAQVFKADAALSVVSIEPAAASKHQFDVTIRAPEDAELFAEGQEGVYLSVKKTSPQHFTLTVDEAPPALEKAGITLTLVTKSAAIETLVELRLKP